MSNDPALAALFEAAARRWNDDGTHASLLEYARVTGKLGDVAAFYRAEAARPGQGERCRRQLSLLLTLAMASLDVKRASPPSSRRWALVVLSLLFLGLTALLVWKAL